MAWSYTPRILNFELHGFTNSRAFTLFPGTLLLKDAKLRLSVAVQGVDENACFHVGDLRFGRVCASFHIPVSYPQTTIPHANCYQLLRFAALTGGEIQSGFRVRIEIYGALLEEKRRTAVEKTLIGITLQKFLKLRSLKTYNRNSLLLLSHQVFLINNCSLVVCDT